MRALRANRKTALEVPFFERATRRRNGDEPATKDKPWVAPSTSGSIFRVTQPGQGHKRRKSSNGRDAGARNQGFGLAEG